MSIDQQHPGGDGVHEGVTIPGKVQAHLSAGEQASLHTDVTIVMPKTDSGELRRTVMAVKGGEGGGVELTARHVGDYAMLKAIAKGGMGEIHLAKDGELERDVAVKVSTVSEGAVDPRFTKEARVLANLAHPNIVPIYNLGVDSAGRPFYSMKLVKGRTLQSIVDAIREGDDAAVGEFTLAKLLTIYRKVCDAMAFAHSKGVLHRDLKPENVMVGEYGEVLVMDWGLAKVVGVQEEVRGGVTMRTVSGGLSGDFGVTMEGEVMGTPQYMSPEQAEGVVSGLDERSDVYALGAILYAVLTYKAPIDGRTLEEVLGNVKRGTLSPMGTAKRMTKGIGGRPEPMAVQVPEALRAVVTKAMAREKEGRYGSVIELVADVEAYQNGFATSAEHAGFVRHVVLLLKRNRLVSGLCAVMVVSLIGFSFRLMVSQRAAIANERRAVEEREAAVVASARAQVSLAESEDLLRDPQAMRRTLDAVPKEQRNQQWDYFDSKLRMPRAHFDIPDAKVEAVFGVQASSGGQAKAGRFLVLQQNGMVRYVDPVQGFGAPLFQLSGDVKARVSAYSEGEGYAWLAIASKRDDRPGEKNSFWTLDVLEIPSGRSVYSVPLESACSSLQFSASGNLLCLTNSAPSNARLEVRNAFTGELQWNHVLKEKGGVSARFSPDENSLFCCVLGKGMLEFQSWSGKQEGSLRGDPSYVNGWRAKSLQAYHVWNFSDQTILRSLDVKTGAIGFQKTILNSSTRLFSAGSGRFLFTVTSTPSEGRLLEMCDAGGGVIRHRAYLLGKFDLFGLHPDEEHLVCFSDARAVFSRWEISTSLVPGLPRCDGAIAFIEGDSRLAYSVTRRGEERWFTSFDLRGSSKPVPRFDRIMQGTGFSMNQARDLVSFKGTAFFNEWVLARLSAKGLQTVEPSGVERWRFHYSPQLSPSGRYAWGLHGLCETKGGVEVREFDRTGFSWNRGSVWIGESTLLELATRSKMNEEESEGFNECAMVLWDVESGRMLRSVPESRARTLCVSPDAQSVAVGTLDGRVVIRSASTLEIQQEYKVHDAEVIRVCWHPTKPVIVTISKDFTAKVWDVRDGSLLATSRFVSIPFQLDISRKGDLIAVGGISRVDVLRLDLSGLRD